MTWKDILKFDSLNNMSRGEFGQKLIDALEALGFEIKYSDDYGDPEYEKYHGKRQKRFRPSDMLTPKEKEDYWGYDTTDFGHDLIITDTVAPYVGAYGSTDTLSIKYHPEDVDWYERRGQEDAPSIMGINTFKIRELKMTTQRGKKKIDVKLDIEEWDNDMDGVRKVTQAILKAFKKYAQHEEDWGDMTDQEISEARGEDAGRRYAGAMRSLGYRDGY